MAKFAFRGKELEEIQVMETKEFASILKSRPRRTLLKGMTTDQKKLLANMKANPKKFHRTKSRDMVIIPEMIGLKVGIHNGKEYVPIELKPEMLGHRLGELVLTRKMVKHSAPGFGATKSSKFVPLK